MLYNFLFKPETTVLAMQVVYALLVLLVCFMYNGDIDRYRKLTLYISMIPMIWSLYIWYLYDSTGQSFQLVCNLSRLHISIGVDAMGLSLLVLTCALFPLSIVLMRTYTGIMTFMLLEI